MGDDALAALVTPDLARGEAHLWLSHVFAEAGLETPGLDARLLLCAAMGIDHAALVRDPAVSLGPASTVLRTFAMRRLRHEPVSRIVGRREFWGLSFKVTPAVLDPRPDTEVLVETVVQAFASRRHEALTLLDLGTGSGAVLAALLSEFPESYGLGTDISFAACQVARENLAALGFARRGSIVQSSWTAAVDGQFDVIVSNPPYISTTEAGSLAPEVSAYDPELALYGGATGLAAYAAIIPALTARLAPGGLAAFETGSTQSRKVSMLLQDAGFAEPGVKTDLAGHERVVFARR